MAEYCHCDNGDGNNKNDDKNESINNSDGNVDDKALLEISKRNKILNQKGVNHRFLSLHFSHFL